MAHSNVRIVFTVLVQGNRKKILVIRYRFIGDTLLMVPFLRNLRYQYPDAQIDVLVAPNSGEILKHCPYINDLIFFDTTRKHRYENANTKPKNFWSYVSEIKARQYDCAFVLKRSLSSAVLAFAAGIPERIGYNTEFRSLLLTKSMPYEMKRHERDCFFDVLDVCNIPVKDDHLEAWWSDEDDKRASGLLASIDADAQKLCSERGIDSNTQTKKILLHLTSSNRAKQWTEDNSIALIDWLINDKGAEIFTIGAPSDKEFYEEISKKISSSASTRFHNLCGETNLLESLAFISKMDMAVGVDSGTLHMAAAVGIPVISLFGPMDPIKWAPIGEQNIVVTEDLDCRPCNLKIKCKYDFECMKSMSLAKVQQAVSQRLEACSSKS